MTENEAIRVLKETVDSTQLEYDESFDMAIKALEEIQAYRALGTVEELKHLKMVLRQILQIWDMKKDCVMDIPKQKRITKIR